MVQSDLPQAPNPKPSGRLSSYHPTVPGKALDLHSLLNPNCWIYAQYLDPFEGYIGVPKDSPLPLIVLKLRLMLHTTFKGLKIQQTTFNGEDYL